MTPPEPHSPRAPQPARDLSARADGDGFSQRDLWNGLDQSWTMTVELLSGILVWGGVGWLLDRWLATTPWLFAIGVFVGFGAGLYLVWLRTARAQRRDDEARALRAEELRARRLRDRRHDRHDETEGQ